jgi:hypothetical protein
MDIKNVTPRHILCFFIGLAIFAAALTYRTWPKFVDAPYKVTVAQDDGTP